MLRICGTYLLLAYGMGGYGSNWMQMKLSALPWVREVSLMSSQSAVAILSSIASGMMAFSGIVFSLLVVGLQFASSTYSPRVFEELENNRLLAHAVGIFTGTFLYSLLAIRSVDLGGVPGLQTHVAFSSLLWLLASVSVWVTLLPRSTNLSITRVLRSLAASGLAAIERGHGTHARKHIDMKPDEVGARPHRLSLRHYGPPAHLVGLNCHRLNQHLSKIDGLIHIPHHIGDVMQPGDVIATLHAARPIRHARPFRRCIWLNAERWIENDPAYAMILLTDISNRALSPAINDPNTAVDVLEQVSMLLRNLGWARFSEQQAHDREKEAEKRIWYKERVWMSWLETGLHEIAKYGDGSRPVRLRLEQLRAELHQTLPPDLLADVHSFFDSMGIKAIEDRSAKSGSNP